MPGLGTRFYNEFENSIECIKQTSQIWPNSLYGMRRFLLKHFPFGIFYEYDKIYIQINAVANHNRAPGYWSNRV